MKEVLQDLMRFPGGVSEGDLAASQAAQTTQLQMSNLLSGQQSNLFEIANMFSNQNLSMMSQNNANLINAIQGFNNLGMQITNQTNTLSTQMQQMSAQLRSVMLYIRIQLTMLIRLRQFLGSSEDGLLGLVPVHRQSELQQPLL